MGVKLKHLLPLIERARRRASHAFCAYCIKPDPSYEHEGHTWCGVTCFNAHKGQVAWKRTIERHGRA